MGDEIPSTIPGRPGRFGSNVHFRAISWQCHVRAAAGVTMLTTSSQDPPTESVVLAARHRRWSSVNRSRRPFGGLILSRFPRPAYGVSSVGMRPELHQEDKRTPHAQLRLE